MEVEISRLLKQNLSRQRIKTRLPLVKKSNRMLRCVQRRIFGTVTRIRLLYSLVLLSNLVVKLIMIYGAIVTIKLRLVHRTISVLKNSSKSPKLLSQLILLQTRNKKLKRKNSTASPLSPKKVEFLKNLKTLPISLKARSDQKVPQEQQPEANYQVAQEHLANKTLTFS